MSIYLLYNYLIYIYIYICYYIYIYIYSINICLSRGNSASGLQSDASYPCLPPWPPKNQGAPGSSPGWLPIRRAGLDVSHVGPRGAAGDMMVT